MRNGKRYHTDTHSNACTQYDNARNAHKPRSVPPGLLQIKEKSTNCAGD
jgi:hypothetical protein